MKKQIKLAIFSFAGLLSLVFAVPAMAINMPGPGMMGFVGPMLAGKVTSVSGNTVVINTADNTSYTVDASNAVIKKGINNFIQVSGIAIGDFLVVQGTINGTNVVAKNILDGTFNHGGINGNKNEDKKLLELQREKELKQNMEKMKRAFPGVVRAITGTSSFTIGTRGLGDKIRDRATTTVVVNTTASTTFMKAGKPASFADVATGLFVEIKGTFATSTNTITAVAVHIGPVAPIKDVEKWERGTTTPRGDDRGGATGTPRGDDWKKGTTSPRGGGFGAAVFNFFRGLSRIFGR